MQITLANLNDATAQQVFDQVARHLLTQKAKSVNEAGCAYRGDNGLMCADGCLIADDEYKPEYDSNFGGTSWNSLVGSGEVPTRHECLIEVLQGIHDVREVDTWEDCLYKVASDYNLTFKGLEAAQ